MIHGTETMKPESSISRFASKGRVAIAIIDLAPRPV